MDEESLDPDQLASTEASQGSDVFSRENKGSYQTDLNLNPHANMYLMLDTRSYWPHCEKTSLLKFANNKGVDQSALIAQAGQRICYSLFGKYHI